LPEATGKNLDFYCEHFEVGPVKGLLKDDLKYHLVVVCLLGTCPFLDIVDGSVSGDWLGVSNDLEEGSDLWVLFVVLWVDSGSAITVIGGSGIVNVCAGANGVIISARITCYWLTFVVTAGVIKITSFIKGCSCSAIAVVAGSVATTVAVGDQTVEKTTGPGVVYDHKVSISRLRRRTIIRRQ